MTWKPPPIREKLDVFDPCWKCDWDRLHGYRMTLPLDPHGGMLGTRGSPHNRARHTQMESSLRFCGSNGFERSARRLMPFACRQPAKTGMRLVLLHVLSAGTLLRHAEMRGRPNCFTPSVRAITALAMQLPSTFIMVRPISIRVSTPRMSKIGATGR
jgi:hypothetical protein